MAAFQKILVYSPVNGVNDPAVIRAADLAKRTGGSIELVDVVEELPAYVRLVAPSSWDVAGLIITERQKALEETAAELQEQGIDAVPRVLRGKPDFAVTQHVIQGEFDLVLKTARGEESSRRVWYGLLAKRLLRGCPCPVWILQPSGPTRFQQVIAAVDTDEPSSEKLELNRKIIESATTLAQYDGAELRVVNAWTAPGETLFRSRMPAEELAQYVTDCREAAQQRADELLAQLAPNSRAKVDLLKGDLQDVLDRLVESELSSLVVMGTICRSGISGYLIGNTAEKVLRSIDCSVLAVKPDDFQSPVMTGADMPVVVGEES